MNHSGEPFTDVVVSYPGDTWPLGAVSSGIGGSSIGGLTGKIPDAVDLSLTSKDGMRHKIHVVIPPQPATKWGDPPNWCHWYLVILSRYQAIATWQDPDFMDIKVLWSCAPADKGAEQFSDVTASYGPVTEQKLDPPPGASTISPGQIGSFEALDVGFKSADGLRHKVHVTLPKPITRDSKMPDIHLLIKSRDQVIATYTYSTPKVLPRWFCTLPPNGTGAFSDVTLAADGRSYPLGECGPGDDASLSAIGPMPKAVDVSFTSKDGKRHKVHVSLPAQAGSQPPYAELFDPVLDDAKAVAQRGSQPPHVDLAIKGSGEVVATVAKPYQVKPPPSWFCDISNNSTERLSGLTIAYDDGKPGRLPDLRPGSGMGMYPDGRMPKMVTIGFTTDDGKRHSVRVSLPEPPDAKNPAARLVIESRDKVVATGLRQVP
jgi:hypothetical protein